ncbi:MAG TPA: hypothetical protein PKL99_07965 [Syntrophales bacterium]|nr:hypothetical protein [Syntrophales bacterium]
MDVKRKKLAGSIQGDIPLVKRPFERLAAEAGLSEKEALEAVRQWLDEGTLRKFGAVLRHRRAGYGENAMVVWAVPPERREEVGRLFASFPEVSHCYERTPAFEGRYVLYTMVHGRGRAVKDIVSSMSRRTGVADCRILETVREFKKTSMRYFP